MKNTTTPALFALTLAAFAIGTSEFVIMGLLVDIAQELKITIAQSGLLVTAYAMGVVIGGPAVAVLTFKLPRKTTLLGLVAVFIFGNILCATAKDYHLLIFARIVTATCHGTYFGIATVAAVKLVDPSRRGEAVAWVFLGTTLANMLGVPLGTAEGFAFGWRSTFWTVVLIGSIAIVALWFLLPQNLSREKADPIQEFKALKNPLVLIPLSLSALANGGLFVVYTFIAPLLMQVSGLSEHGVTIVLMILGIGLPIGTLIGGKLADQNLTQWLTILFSALVLILLAMHEMLPFAVPAVMSLFLWSTLIFTIAPMLQLMVVNNSAQAPNLASTFNQSAFNLGNACGSLLGSTLIHHHLPLADLPLISVIFMAGGIIMTYWYKRIYLQQKTLTD